MKLPTAPPQPTDTPHDPRPPLRRFGLALRFPAFRPGPRPRRELLGDNAGRRGSAARMRRRRCRRSRDSRGRRALLWRSMPSTISKPKHSRARATRHGTRRSWAGQAPGPARRSRRMTRKTMRGGIERPAAKQCAPQTAGIRLPGVRDPARHARLRLFQRHDARPHAAREPRPARMAAIRRRRKAAGHAVRHGNAGRRRDGRQGCGRMRRADPPACGKNIAPGGWRPLDPHKRQGTKDSRLNSTSWQLGNRDRRCGYR